MYKNGKRYGIYSTFISIQDEYTCGKNSNSSAKLVYPNEIFVYDNGMRIDVSIEAVSLAIEMIVCQFR